MTPDGTPVVVAALYTFAALPDFRDRQAPLLAVCREAGVYGTLLLAHEGINGTIAGPRHGIDAAVAHIRQIPGCGDLQYKESFAETRPFYRMKVRLKKEIVTMGEPDVDPHKMVGTYVDPGDWNALISDPDVIVIDTRNDYEFAIGSFQGAIDPDIATFREFPDWFRKTIMPEAAKGKKVAMFCTGGIRCEKSTAFAKQLGVEAVYHLKGGILKYLETVPEEDSLWDGECFVFDQRVSIKHGLALGSYDTCHACRRPIDSGDKASAQYEAGVSCPHCHDIYDAKQKQRFRDRQHQVDLADKRGETHFGAGG
ncbi:MAG: oxygen-dependent tRNA uridine(34) hydroxylase TrhO [Alphaproteobacteria bacterium]